MEKMGLLHFGPLPEFSSRFMINYSDPEHDEHT